MLLPGKWVEVLPASEIMPTLDADQAVDGLPFMPEMARHCGHRYRVAMRAERVCTFPPTVPFPRLAHTVVLEDLRCDGADHGGCQLGCMLLWKEGWLRPVTDGARVDGPGTDRAGTHERGSAATPGAMDLRALRPGESDVYFCQATELARATGPGEAMLRPGQYLRFLRHRTFTPVGLASMLLRVGSRGARRALLASWRPAPVGERRPVAPLGLEPGDWVQVKRRAGIMRTLDARYRQRGLPFGGDMYEQCGRRMRVARRVDTIVLESTGKLHQMRDTVILDGPTCDRYLGCARGMPFLWREAWLERAEPARARVRATGPRRRPRWALAVKRAIDITGALAAIVVLSPLLAWTALAIVATDGLPILFRQLRPGLRGKAFRIAKFRTMRAPRPGEVWYLTDDERLTRVGRFLRSSSIDELPELWNVLRGEMSLVGPRPLLVEYLDTYTPEQRRRHDMKPGITGWAAVNGRHALRFDDRVALDVWYVDHWSLGLDLRIIARTAAQVLLHRDVATTQNLEDVGFPLPGVGGLPMGEALPDIAGAAGPDVP